jgi:hypothetical protein
MEGWRRTIDRSAAEIALAAIAVPFRVPLLSKAEISINDSRDELVYMRPITG